MKKFIAIVFAVLMAFTASAQLTMSKTAQSAKNSTVYKWGGTLMKPRAGIIMYIGNTYVLLGSSTNKYERNFHSILLGDTKEQAINTITQLTTIGDSITRDNDLDVMGMNSKTTTLFKFLGTVCFKTVGVAGESDCLYYMPAEDVITAIREYSEN